MKSIRLIFALLILATTTSFAQETNKPFIILELEGDVMVTNLQGETFDAQPATYMYAGNTIHLGENSYVLLNHGVLTIPLRDKGNYDLDDDLEMGIFALENSIDPQFSDFSAFSIEMVIDAKKYGGWALDTGNKGNAWGPKAKKNPDGWGIKDRLNPGGWGIKDRLNPGGWGANPFQSRSGLGVVSPDNGGWGIKDRLNPGGWGIKDRLNPGGWGIKDRLNPGGWGIKDRLNPGGWGANDPRAMKAWGIKDRLNPGGWGVEDMTIEPTVPGGFYLGKINQIEWLNELGVTEYLFIIADTSNHLIHSEISSSRKVDFDFSILEPGKVYYWQVFAEGKKAISPPTHFKVTNLGDYQQSINKYIESNIYDSASNALKGLIKAYAQEELGYFFEANEHYKYLLKKYPNNDLIKVNYTSFSLRMGQFNQAQDIALRI